MTYELGEELFPGFDFEACRVAPPPAGPGEDLSPGQRRRRRQEQALGKGNHPLGLAFRVALLLHSDAPPVDDREAPGPRCGSCRFRELMHAGSRSQPKCLRGWRPGKPPPWATHGAATDVRAWWPACRHWEPEEASDTTTEGNPPR